MVVGVAVTLAFRLSQDGLRWASSAPDLIMRQAAEFPLEFIPSEAEGRE
jgi:hypothetical protein